MGDEPGYITDLKDQIGDVQKGVNETEKAIVRIDTTLAANLPPMKQQLQTLNGTVRQHDTDIALQKQAHEECPARKAVDAGADLPRQARSHWVVDLSNNRTKAAVGGGIIGFPAIIFLLLEIAKLAVEHTWGG